MDDIVVGTPVEQPVKGNGKPMSWRRFGATLAGFALLAVALFVFSGAGFPEASWEYLNTLTYCVFGVASGFVITDTYLKRKNGA